MKCGAKAPAIPKKDKKARKEKRKKRSKVKIIIPVIILLILAVLSFLLFGGEWVPEKIREMKGYAYLTGMVKEKLPDRERLPFVIPGIPDIPDRFPFGFSFELPFELPDSEKLLGGEEPDNAGGEKTSVAGVDNKLVLKDEALYRDLSVDWEHSNLKVLEHYTDVEAGTDTVVVYMELKNSYVNMTGTKEVTYQYNKDTKEWEAVAVSKLTALSIEPVTQ